MKKKFAVLTSGWSVDYVTSCLEGMKEACASINADLYVFCCYKYAEPSGETNTTGFAIYDLINFSDFNGIIIMPNLFNDDGIVEKVRQRIAASKVPAISTCQRLKDLHFINNHNYDGMQELVSHLIKHHNITSFALINGPRENDGAKTILKAVTDTLHENNLSISKDDIYENRDWSYKSAYKLATQLFSKEKIPQAVICLNDFSAMAAISAAIEHNYRVPDDVKIISFDGASISSNIIPSITTLNDNSKRVGQRAIEILASKPEELYEENIKGVPIYRQSCGCQKVVSNNQILFSQKFTTYIDREQRFSSQLRHLEDEFINYETVESLIENLQSYFENRHYFEGTDFSIMINKSSIENLRSKNIKANISSPFDETVQAIVSLKDGVGTAREQISSRKLIPSYMESDEPGTYLFLPIYNQKNIYGYYVSQNYVGLLESKSAYNWIRNFGNMLEKYRQTAIYKITSEKYEILSTHDALSGLYNRTGLERYGSNLYNSNCSQGLVTTIIFIDINDMKIINDRYGHLHGDLAVKTVAESIHSSIPENYIAIRYGGDEFVVIGEKNTINYALKIKREIKTQVNKMALPYEITVSSGTKTFSAADNLSLEEAIIQVDKVMYKAKEKYHKSMQK